jgi:hypothetical protein
MRLSFQDEPLQVTPVCASRAESKDPRDVVTIILREVEHGSGLNVLSPGRIDSRDGMVFQGDAEDVVDVLSGRCGPVATTD